MYKHVYVHIYAYIDIYIMLNGKQVRAGGGGADALLRDFILKSYPWAFCLRNYPKVAMEIPSNSSNSAVFMFKGFEFETQTLDRKQVLPHSGHSGINESNQLRVFF